MRGTVQRKIPLYGGRVIMCRSRKALRLVYKALRMDEPETPPDFLGFYQQVDRPDGKAVYIIGWLDRDDGTLVHECVHVAQCILTRAGMDIRDSNGEAMAYLTDWLFSHLRTP